MVGGQSGFESSQPFAVAEDMKIGLGKSAAHVGNQSVDLRALGGSREADTGV
jgi:hypothetical protein